MALVAVCCLLAFATVAVQSHDAGQQVCREVENVVARHCNQRVPNAPQLLVGPPGKRGQKGSKGEFGGSGPPGPKGNPGDVDDARLNSAIKAAMATVVDELDNKIERLNERFEEMNERLDQSQPSDSQEEKPDLERKCEVAFDGKCFWAIVYPTHNVTYAAGEKLCEDEGGTAGNIYSNSHYNSIMTYSRTLKNSYYYIWLGMKINPSTKALSLFDGTSAVFVHWFPGYPKSHTTSTILAISIQPDPNSSSQGMFNNANPTSASYYGVLCERNV